jgi:hypothetical protein
LVSSPFAAQLADLAELPEQAEVEVVAEVAEVVLAPAVSLVGTVELLAHPPPRKVTRKQCRVLLLKNRKCSS